MKLSIEERKPTIVEAYVDPFEPPMTPKTDPEFARNMAEAFAKGQPYATRIGLTHVNVQNKIKETFKSLT